ncbi:MAG TPA: hypothetical protein VK210_06065, partial [Terriglobia bacterium]|nr:hypothetical protein [Terriglobia bacterium]
KLPTDFDSALSRQVDIDKETVDGTGTCQLQSSTRGLRLDGLIAFALQSLDHHLSDVGIIIRNQNATVLQSNSWNSIRR